MTSESLITEDLRDIKLAYELLEKKPPELDPNIRTFALISVLQFRFKSGQLHEDEFNRGKDLLFDNLASKDKEAALNLRKKFPSIRRRYDQALEVNDSVDSAD